MLRAAAIAPSAACLSPPTAPGGGVAVDAAPGGDPDAVPVPPSQLDPGLSGGYRTFCAIRGPERSLYCWGENADGQVATGLYEPDFIVSPTLAHVGPDLPLTGVTEAASGDAQTCAVMEDGTVRCWGRDGVGQLGDGGGNDGGTPYADRQVRDLTEVATISSVGRHVCAVSSGGSLHCWGRDLNGELGDGPPEASFATAPQVVIDEGDLPIEDAREVGVGAYHTCAVRADRTVACAGLDDSGQLGRLAEEPFLCSRDRMRTVPASEGAALEPVSQVAGNVRHTCAVVAGAVYCWGSPGCGQLGDGGEPGCAETTTPGSCEQGAAQPPEPVAFEPDTGCEVEQVELGAAFSCARCSDGRVFCWGSGADGQLGNGDVVASRIPVKVLGITSATDLAVTEATACALLAPEIGEDGEVWCWGRGEFGELGDEMSGPGHFSLVAQPVVGLP